MPNILSINTTAIAHFGHQRKPICFNHSSGTATANFHPFHPGANSTDLHSFPYQSTDSFSFKFNTYTHIYQNTCNQGYNNVARFTTSPCNLCRIAHRSHEQLGKEPKAEHKGSSWRKPHRVGPEKVAKGEGSPERPRRKGAAKYQSENQHAAEGRGGETAKGCSS